MRDKKNLTVYEICYTEHFGENERHESFYIVAADDYEAVEFARHFAKTFYTDGDEEDESEDEVGEIGEDVDEPEEWRAENPNGDCTVEFTSIWANPYIYIEAVEGHDDICLALRAEYGVPYEGAIRAKRPVEMGD